MAMVYFLILHTAFWAWSVGQYGSRADCEGAGHEAFAVPPSAASSMWKTNYFCVGLPREAPGPAPPAEPMVPPVLPVPEPPHDHP